MNNATEVLLLLFLIITFLQSGFDKITDWNGNVSWLKEHFSKTPFKNSVPLLVGIILVMDFCRPVIKQRYSRQVRSL